MAAGVEAACGRPVAPGCMQLWRALLLLLLLLLLLHMQGHLLLQLDEP